MRGFIVEGVTAVGKTTVLRLLQERLAAERPACTKLILSEHYTERVLEDRKAAGTLTHQDALEHSTGILALLERLGDWKAGGKFAAAGGNAEMLVLVERFFGSHAANLCVSTGADLPAPAFRGAVDLYAGIAALGLRVLLLTIDPERIPAAIADTLERRNDVWCAHVQTLGGLNAAAAHFQAWQDALLAFYSALAGRVPVTIDHMSTSALSYPAIAEALVTAL